MEGPSGDHRPRTAGERAGTAGGNASGVRDWQKNTWFGPAPLNNNPFDEPEDAPELKEIRSQNVNEHMGDFWMPHDAFRAGETDPQTDPKQRRAGQSWEKGTARKPEARKIRRLPIVIGVLMVLTAVILILRFAVFSVKEIRVIGNSQIPAGEIIRISGIRQGDSILSIEEKKVEQRISSDYRLQFRYLSRQLPSTVVLSVREREACCWLTYCGILYVMDKNRMVLSESENPDERRDDLVEVRGLDIRSNTMVGQVITLGSEEQQLIFGELFLEMKVLSCTGLIKEVDISNTGSILLATRDQYTVALGGGENIHAKLRSMLLVREELQRMGQTGGTINVLNPESPIYTP